MRGFTLLEILISFTIMSLIVAGIFAIINVAEVSWNSDMAFLDIQQQVRLSMDGMIRESRQAKPGDITVSGGGGRIDFLVPKPSAAGFNPVAYYLQSGRIIREHPAGTTKILADYITSLNFCCLGGADCTDCTNANSLRIQIQGSRTMKGRTSTFPLTEKVMLRNE
jgi:type II secretory pathway pseudopilin PulG